MVEFNYIVRVIGKDLDGTKSIESGLQGIKGIGQRMGEIIANKFRQESKASPQKLLGELTNEEVELIEDIINNPAKHNIPSWVLNRRKDYDDGSDKHLTMNDLAFSLRNDLTRIAEIKSYKGLRHMWGLPVRGQKTKSRHRGKGGVVGVVKKENLKPATSAKVLSKSKK